MAKNGWLPHTDALSGEKTGWFGSELPKNASSSWNPLGAALTTPTPPLSKEYIYAGSRLLAVEDANANAATPTPTPSPGNGCTPTNYSYDTLNNLTTVNQGVQTRSFAYNSLSRLLSATNPESGTISYLYDPNGNLTQKTDARLVQTNYIYDALNRVTNRNYSAPANLPNYQATPNVAYTYDNASVPFSKGKLTKVASSVSTTEYTGFDILGRVLAHKQTTDGTAYMTAYTYNLSGALIEETYPSGRVVKNTLSIDGDLQQVQSKRANDTFRNYANGFIYTSSGAVASMRLGNGKFESTQFNSRLQPTQIGLGSSATSQNLLKLNYDYGSSNINGNVQSQTITIPTVGSYNGFVATQNYSYDELNRLKNATENVTPNGGMASQSWKQTFTFDRYGNRRFDFTNGNTTVPSPGCSEPVCNPQINPSNNRLVGYGYDNAGNTTSDQQGNSFIYDAENKQVQVTNGANVVGQYFYDGDGKRIKKLVPSTGETTIFVYDAGGKTIAEYSTIIESTATAKTNYLTLDHLGSPRINTDSIDQVTSGRDFRPFGEEISRSNYGSDSVRKKFTGYERDNEVNLDFAQARYYNNQHGRFTTVDPLMASMSLANPQSFNRYTYVLNNPTNLVDPLGLDDCDLKKRNCPSTTGGIIIPHPCETGTKGCDPNDTHIADVEVRASENTNNLWAFPYAETFNLLQRRIRNRSISPIKELPHPPPSPPTVPCSELGVNLSVFAGMGVGGNGAAGTAGIIGAVDFNGYNSTSFLAPYGGIFFGGSANGGGVGAPSREGFALGGAVSGGPSIFLSNAGGPSDQPGNFNTHIVATPILTITVDRGLDPQVPVTNISVGGPSLGAGYFWFQTNTPKTRDTMLNFPGCARVR